MGGRSISDPGSRAAARAVAIAAAGAFGLSLALFWPGIAMYDSVAQYAQALSGRYEDWHPPAMARLWSLFGARGAAPLLILQMAGYWFGLGALATALARSGRRGAAWTMLAIGIWPPLLGWQAVVLKDTQMLAAMLAATGIVGWWRLRDRRVPAAAWIVVAGLLGYATLVRANAVFAAVPLLALLIEARMVIRLGGAMIGIVAVLAVAPVVNHAVLGATPSGVERTQALYDLAGIAVRTGDAAATGLAPATIAVLRAKRCVRPFFWDPLGDPDRCDDDVGGLRMVPPDALYGRLAAAILQHPIAYAEHRIAHLNSTDRWLVPWAWPNAVPPQASEKNDEGLGQPGAIASRFERFAGHLVELPVMWPVITIMLAIGGCIVAARAADRSARLALALFGSALALEASFAAISIASDLRYHLWPLVATAIGAVLLGARLRRMPVAIVAAVAILFVAGAAARIVLPPAPIGYRALLG